jgi:hypothetical protein
MPVSPRARRFLLRRNPKALASWRAFVRRQARSARPPDGVVEYAGPTELWIPEQPRFLLYFTKDAMFRWWFRAFAGQVPQHIGVIAHGSTPSPSAAKLMLGVAESLGVPLVLLGDLDPGDLTAFAALASGRSGNLLYGGVDDDLLQLARRHIGPRRFERECLLGMSPLEREQLALLSPLCPPLSSLCGSAAARLLGSGLKCELEAILGPHICDGAFLAAVRRHFTSRLPARLGL